MEVFTDVDEGSFVTNHLFRRPTGTKNNFERCIALGSEWGPFLIALYSVMVTLLFAFCWEIVSVAVISRSNSLDKPKWDPKKHYADLEIYEQALEEHEKYLNKPAENLTQHQRDLNERKEKLENRKKDLGGSASNYSRILRGILLVGFWNAREPLLATRFMWSYLIGLRRGKHTITSSTTGLLLLALVWLLGTYAASIFVAGTLITEKVAPANPARVYVPRGPVTDSADIMRLQALRAPATLRALGSAEAASNQHTIRNRFSLDPHLSSGDSPQYFTYNYTVTAHDMGLQKWYDLKQEVGGRCDVDSSWFSKNVPEEDLDVYRPWGLANKTVNVVYDGERKTAPSATAIPFPYADQTFLIHQEVEHRYGIIVHSSHRASHRPGTDPWYKTEAFTPKDNDTDAQIEEQPGNRVMGGRPALSCTQNDVWFYNGTRFKNIFELTDEANIKLPDGWVAQLQLDFPRPRIIDMINSAGSSSLVSSTTFVGGRFDAETSMIEKDMTRLLTATWIATADTFRNMLMVGDQQQNIPNAALEKNGKPQTGVELFVVSTPKVSTLRLSVLVIIPTLLGVFTLVLSILRCWFRSAEWYKNIHFAEGAYLYARTQDPEKFQKIERLEEVLEKSKYTPPKDDNSHQDGEGNQQ